MTCLRLRRLPAPFGFLGCLCALLAALAATGGPLMPGALARAAVTTPRSRTHHPVSSLVPLHYTERSFPVPRKGKSGAKHAPAAATGVKGKRSLPSVAPARRHGREQAPEPADTIPMHRIGHAFGTGNGNGTAHGSGTGRFTPSRNLRQLAQGTASRSSSRAYGRPGRRIPLPAPEPPHTVTAGVTGRSSHGDPLATLHGNRAQPHTGLPQAAFRGRNSVVVATASSSPQPWVTPYASSASGSGLTQAASRNPNPARLGRQPPSAPYLPQGRDNTGYATGIASPPDDRYPDSIAAPYRRPAAQGTQPMAPYSTSPVITPTVQAPALPGRQAPNSQVIGGFGSELALAPAPSSDRFGLTRRRPHPLAASALPEDARSTSPATMAASLPNTLSERDAITAAAISPAILPDIYDRDGRLLMPAPLKGSREVLVHQNTMADNDGLGRIANNAELDHLRATHELVDLPASGSLRINEDLPYNRRAARPWTALFTQDIARDYYARFHQPLWVTSAVRTVAFQSHLLRVNGNAAGLYGDFASPHLTGQAVDFGKRGMTAAQLAWMRSYLLPLIQSGKIDVEEEFQQACFHISVYRRYAGGRHIVNEVAQAVPQPAPQHVPPPPSLTPVRPAATALPTDTNDNDR